MCNQGATSTRSHDIRCSRQYTFHRSCSCLECTHDGTKSNAGPGSCNLRLRHTLSSRSLHMDPVLDKSLGCRPLRPIQQINTQTVAVITHIHRGREGDRGRAGGGSTSRFGRMHAFEMENNKHTESGTQFRPGAHFSKSQGSV